MQSLGCCGLRRWGFTDEIPEFCSKYRKVGNVCLVDCEDGPKMWPSPLDDSREDKKIEEATKARSRDPVLPSVLARTKIEVTLPAESEDGLIVRTHDRVKKECKILK